MTTVTVCNFGQILIFLEIVTIAKYTKHCITFFKFRNTTVYTKNITPSGAATALWSVCCWTAQLEIEKVPIPWT